MTQLSEEFITQMNTLFNDMSESINKFKLTFENFVKSEEEKMNIINEDNDINIIRKNKLKSIANSDNDNIIYDEINNLLYIKHNSLGLLPFKVIGYNVDGKDCVTLMADKMVAKMQWNNYSCNWQDSYIRTWLNNDFYDGLPNSIKNIITTVSKKTNKSQSTTMLSNTETIWLLSKEEAEGKSNYSDTFMTGCLSYWWLRSPSIINNLYACCVTTTGGVYGNAITNSCGVVPCFVIK